MWYNNSRYRKGNHHGLCLHLQPSDAVLQREDAAGRREPDHLRRGPHRRGGPQRRGEILAAAPAGRAGGPRPGGYCHPPEHERGLSSADARTSPGGHHHPGGADLSSRPARRGCERRRLRGADHPDPAGLHRPEPARGAAVRRAADAGGPGGCIVPGERRAAAG